VYVDEGESVDMAIGGSAEEGCSAVVVVGDGSTDESVE